jgi:hypothetical protein
MNEDQRQKAEAAAQARRAKHLAIASHIYPSFECLRTGIDPQTRSLEEWEAMWKTFLADPEKANEIIAWEFVGQVINDSLNRTADLAEALAAQRIASGQAQAGAQVPAPIPDQVQTLGGRDKERAIQR